MFLAKLFIAMQLLFLLLLPLFLLLWWQFDRRYRGRQSSRELRPTGEIFRDPGSGRLMQVYENPQTGEREYREK